MLVAESLASFLAAGLLRIRVEEAVSSKVHQRTRPLGRMVVHASQLERSLENFNEELGRKVAMTLAKYDGQSVRPLRKRLDWLEKPLVVRAWLRCGQAWTWLYSGRAWARLKVKLFVRLPPPVPEEPKADGGVA